MARSEKKRRLRWALGWVFGLGFAGYLIWALRAEDALHVVHKQLEQTSAGIVVTGEIHNASATPASVNVEVSFFNSNGQKLADEVIALPSLPVGASASFRTQPKMLSDVKDYSIYVHSGKNMYGN